MALMIKSILVLKSQLIISLFKLLSLFLISFFCILSNASGQPNSLLVEAIIIEGIGIKNVVQVGQKKREVIKQLGKPKKFVEYGEGYRNENTGVQVYKRWKVLDRTNTRHYYREQEIEIFYINNVVYDIYFLSSDYVTTKGIKVGDSKSKAIGVYPSGNFFRDSIWQIRDQGIDIIFECETVKKIRIYDPVI